MSKTRTKEELIRLAWIAALRRSGHRKCVEDYSTSKGRVCALGLLAEVAGINARDVQGLELHEVGALAGLCKNESRYVAWLNDGNLINIRPHTFREIADIVEGWVTQSLSTKVNLC